MEFALRNGRIFFSKSKIERKREVPHSIAMKFPEQKLTDGVWRGLVARM